MIIRIQLQFYRAVPILLENRHSRPFPVPSPFYRHAFSHTPSCYLPSNRHAHVCLHIHLVGAKHEPSILNMHSITPLRSEGYVKVRKQYALVVNYPTHLPLSKTQVARVCLPFACRSYG